MQQNAVLSGELTLNYKRNGAGSFNLLAISGTPAGEYLQNTGGEREGAKKIPEGESKSSHFHIHPRAPGDDTAKGWRLGLLLSPGAGSLQSLHCNPTSCTFLGQGGRWGRGRRGSSLLRQGSSEAKPQYSASPWAKNLLTCSIPAFSRPLCILCPVQIHGYVAGPP